VKQGHILAALDLLALASHGLLQIARLRNRKQLGLVVVHHRSSCLGNGGFGLVNGARSFLGEIHGLFLRKTSELFHLAAVLFGSSTRDTLTTGLFSRKTSLPLPALRLLGLATRFLRTGDCKHNHLLLLRLEQAACRHTTE
jgi:hypothetical protein